MVADIRAVSLTAEQEQERELRRDLAAVFRIAARFGWNEQTGNHNSVMMPRRRADDPPTFLINARGRLFQEITASSLLVSDIDGQVLRGDGELGKAALAVHTRIHMANPSAICVLHVHPQYLTALSLLAEPGFVISHHGSPLLHDRVAIDTSDDTPVDGEAEGDRLAAVLGEKTILLMGASGATVVGRTVAEAFDECFMAERAAMYQVTAMSTGQPLRASPERSRRRFSGSWGEQVDARQHLDAWRRVLDREEPDYAR